MSVVIDIKHDFVPKCSTHGWNKRLTSVIKLAQMATTLDIHVIDNFICTKCRGESEYCSCTFSNPHSTIMVVYSNFTHQVKSDCQCEFMCKCNTVEVV